MIAMDKVFIIARKDISEALCSKSAYVYVLFLFFIALSYFDGFRNVMSNLTKQMGNPVELQQPIKSFLNGVAYTLPLVLSMLFCSFLSAYSVIMDKAKRTLESLLATPLSLRQIWIGKSLAVALPGIVVTLVILFLALVVLNIVFIAPTVGGFIMPSVLSLVTALIIVPVMVFLVVLIVSFLQLIMANPRIANFAYMAFFLGIYMSTITELAKSWDFSLIYLMITLLLTVVTLFLARFLTKEKVVLSSKG